MKTLQRIYSDKDSEIFIFNSDENRAVINTTIVPDEQLEKILKYKEEEDQVKRLLARTFLFEYCQKKYNLNDFSFEYTENQRPKFKQSDIDFSISYSKNIIAIALSKKHRIGVDIEFLEPSIVSKEVASEFMHDKELVTYMQMDEKSKNRYFYEKWTAKESLLKAQGDGLTINPKDVINTQKKFFYFSEYIVSLSIMPLKTQEL
jgi:4'-phosphopantetheinyl transferase